jgi:hypothetical protein
MTAQEQGFIANRNRDRYGISQISESSQPPHRTAYRRVPGLLEAARVTRKPQSFNNCLMRAIRWYRFDLTGILHVRKTNSQAPTLPFYGLYKGGAAAGLLPCAQQVYGKVQKMEGKRVGAMSRKKH